MMDIIFGIVDDKTGELMRVRVDAERAERSCDDGESVVELHCKRYGKPIKPEGKK